MELEWIRNLCTLGDPLLIFGAMSVTETLPHGTPGRARRGAAHHRFVTRSCWTGVYDEQYDHADVPFENLIAYYRAVQESALVSRAQSARRPRMPSSSLLSRGVMR